MVQHHKTGRPLNPVFIRYILIFLLFALLLLVFFTPFYRFIMDFTLQNELKYIRDKLNDGISVMDSAVSSLNNAVFTTTRDSRFRVFKNSEPPKTYNPYALWEFQDSLNSLILSQSLIADCGIIFSGTNVITRQRIFFHTDQYSFYDEFFYCQEHSFDEWFALIQSGRPFTPAREYWGTDYGSYRAITFQALWAAMNYPDEAILFATIPVKSIIPLLAEKDIAEKSRIRISDIRGNTLIDEGNTSISEKVDYHVVRIQSSSSSLIFEINVPDSLITGKMRHVKTLLLLFSVLLIVITLSMSLLFAHKTSAPMRRFMAKIDTIKNLRAVSGSTGADEQKGMLRSFGQIYSDITDSIVTVDARLESSLQIIEQQAELLKNQIFDSSLQRGIYTAEEQQQFLAVFTDFPKKFQLADIRYRLSGEYNFEENLALQMKLVEIVKEYQNRNRFSNIYIHSRGGNIIIILLPLSSENEPWYDRLNTLRNELNPKVNLTLSFALSDTFEKPSDLYRAWQQLQFIHILRGSNYMTGVMRSGDIPEGSAQLPINLSSMEMIYNSLNNANAATACSILEECIALLPSSGDQLAAGIVYSHLSNLILQMKLENPAVLYDIEIPVYARESLDEAFKKQFPKCFHLICEKILNRSQSSITTFGQKIIDFINDHLYDPNLYITMISDHFNISPPTLQKLVKKISGQTFLAYVENQRLGKAHKLLLSGKYSIQETAAQCGFAKADSFYKAFKRTYGFPPSAILNNRVVSASGK